MPSWELQLQRGVWIYMNFYLLMNGDILILCYINIQMMLTQSYLETWRNFVRSAVFWNGDRCISPIPSWRPSLDTYLHCLWIIAKIRISISILLVWFLKVNMQYAIKLYMSPALLTVSAIFELVRYFPVGPTQNPRVHGLSLCSLSKVIKKQWNIINKTLLHNKLWLFYNKSPNLHWLGWNNSFKNCPFGSKNHKS